MPTKLFYIQHNENSEQLHENSKQLHENSKQLHENIYKEQFHSEPTNNNDLHNQLINAILKGAYEYRSTNGSLKSSQFNKPQSGELLVEIETDDNNNIVQIKSQFGNTQASSLNDEAKSGVNKLLGLNANNNNNNDEKVEKSTRVYVKHNNKSKKSHSKSLTDNNTFKTMLNQSLQSSDSLSPCPFRRDVACRILNQSKYPESYVVDLISDQEGNFIRIDSTFGSVNAQDLEESAQRTIEGYLLLNDFEIVSSEDSKPTNNNNNQNKPSAVFSSTIKDRHNNEDLDVYKTHYKGNSYSLTMDNHGHQIYAIQDTENFQRYKSIQPQDVPAAVDNAFEQKVKNYCNIQKILQTKIDKIIEALNNDSLWKENGKDISSVPKKLLRIINNDNYSPSEKYNLLVQEATHQQQQKRGKFGSFFKGGQRLAQVTSLLKNVANGEDVDIEKLTNLATGSNNNNNNNNTLNFKSKFNDVKRDEHGLYNDTNIFNL